MLVEVVGYPGSGKTALVRELEHRARARAEYWHGSRSSPGGVRDRARLSIRDPVMAGLFYSLWATCRPFRVRRLRRVLMLQRRRGWALEAQRRDALVVTDEMFVHGLFQFLFGSRRTRVVQKLVEEVLRQTYDATATRFVHLTAPKEVIRHRFLTRVQRSRFARSSTGTVLEEFDNDEWYSWIADLLERRYPDRIHVVDAEASLHDVVEKVASLLEVL